MSVSRRFPGETREGTFMNSIKNVAMETLTGKKSNTIYFQESRE